LRADAGQDFDAGELVHAPVEQHEVRPEGAELLEGFLRVDHPHTERVAVAFEHAQVRLNGERVIVDDEDARIREREVSHSFHTPPVARAKPAVLKT
jgi:hypothetical protein